MKKIIDYIDNSKSNETKTMQFLKAVNSPDSVPLVMWGCGNFAENVYKWLINKGITLSDVFVDKNYYKEGEEFHGFKICTLEEICNKYPSFNILIGFMDAKVRNYDDLKNNIKNIKNIFTNITLSVLDYLESINYNFVKKNESLFQWTYEQLADELSRKSYIAYLNAKIKETDEGIFSLYCKNSNDQYLDRDIIKLEQDETFVDCGAYNGDTILSFVNKMSELSLKYDSIYAFEPDSKNYSELLALSNSVPNLNCINKGVWNKTQTLKFKADASVLSAISNEGNIIIETDTIDNIVQGKRVSFIKMDIEGAELPALKGAEQTIKTYKPKLAICAYHKADDLITIPQYIKSLVPEYKFYFRLHKPSTTDAIIFAVI